MPTPTYIALANITLTQGDSEIVFSNIPNTYRDLVIVCNWQNSGNSSATRLQLNSDTNANYSGVWMVGITNQVGGMSPGAYSSSEASATGARLFGAAFGPVNNFSNFGIVHIMDYSATDKHKTVLSRYGTAATNGDTQATFSRWASTNAVTSVTLYDVVGQTYTLGSTFSLYGIVS